MRKFIGSVALLSLACLFCAGATNAAVIQNVSTPVNISAFVPCANSGAGEVVDVFGDLHVLVSLTINNNNVSGKLQFQPQGISGVGESTGAKYQASGGTSTTFSTSLVNGQANQTFINTFKLVGQGPRNNFTVMERAHITFNADGTVTAFHDDFTVSCK